MNSTASRIVLGILGLALLYAGVHRLNDTGAADPSGGQYNSVYESCQSQEEGREAIASCMQGMIPGLSYSDAKAYVAGR